MKNRSLPPPPPPPLLPVQAHIHTHRKIIKKYRAQCQNTLARLIENYFVWFALARPEVSDVGCMYGCRSAAKLLQSMIGEAKMKCYTNIFT